MSGMLDDIQIRLAAAAEAVREHQVTTQRCRELGERVDGAQRQLGLVTKAHAAEAADVAKLEGMSLTRIWLALRGARDDALARERAEEQAAAYRVAEAKERLRVLADELAVARARLATLRTAEFDYTAVLAEKEQHLADSGDPRAGRLLELAERRGSLTAELKELREAAAAAARAAESLDRVAVLLGKADDWSGYDTWLGGGAFSSAMKHDRMDEAASAATVADHHIAKLRTELADVRDVNLTLPELELEGFTRFADVWFDNIFTDLAVRDRIKQALRNVGHSVERVAGLRRTLDRHLADTTAALEGAERERRAVLAS
ncbi:hypothetical protein QEZ54_17220 [Catellatospora sp. KI3]|uniref:hypothetical protein n=1 Tax=Catellatospora sp. KI3 TaxID=3041620 RepID=UPI0024821593|nr:hypothetical protein [Catellatospora sp. KI3]MDI1462718.1 hypothetical protein [Catellatospora sp. KI3]